MPRAYADRRCSLATSSRALRQLNGSDRVWPRRRGYRSAGDALHRLCNVREKMASASRPVAAWKCRSFLPLDVARFAAFRLFLGQQAGRCGLRGAGTAARCEMRPSELSLLQMRPIPPASPRCRQFSGVAGRGNDLTHDVVAHSAGRKNHRGASLSNC